MRIGTAINRFTKIKLDIAKSYIPFLLGLDVLYQEQLVPYNVENVLYCKSTTGSSLSLANKDTSS